MVFCFMTTARDKLAFIVGQSVNRTTNQRLQGVENDVEEAVSV